ncbi:MAG: stage V sporulation protein AE [Ruminococcaceae bacterium]|nr:stage V sporulation protein AE [Oscillospiraceae bacterium]
MIAKAFLVGGGFCVVGQLLVDLTGLTPARILVGYVTAGVLLTAVGVYDPLVRFAGAGATVPLTGFGYSLATGVREAIAKDGVFGILTGGLTATAGGIAAAITFSLVVALCTRSKDKS